LKRGSAPWRGSTRNGVWQALLCKRDADSE
jgi:hypothetical protein